MLLVLQVATITKTDPPWRRRSVGETVSLNEFASASLDSWPLGRTLPILCWPRENSLLCFESRKCIPATRRVQSRIVQKRLIFSLFKSHSKRGSYRHCHARGFHSKSHVDINRRSTILFFPALTRASVTLEFARFVERHLTF